MFYAIQTLLQLIPLSASKTIILPAVSIRDTPRFGWRGAMLDVVRHFFGVQDVKRFIDLIAYYKLNRLHLHLSDDQGWRIEIKFWPQLTEVGGSTQDRSAVMDRDDSDNEGHRIYGVPAVAWG